jgi:hypothetical protein
MGCTEVDVYRGQEILNEITGEQIQAVSRGSGLRQRPWEGWAGCSWGGAGRSPRSQPPPLNLLPPERVSYGPVYNYISFLNLAQHYGKSPPEAMANPPAVEVWKDQRLSLVKEGYCGIVKTLEFRSPAVSPAEQHAEAAGNAFT